MNQFKPLLVVLGFVSLALGFIGIFLPLFPTTPFVLIASFLFFHSSARFHHWLEHHKVFGPYLREWHAGHGFSQKRKKNILIFQGVITVITVIFVPILLAKIVVVISLVCFFIFLKILPTVDLDVAPSRKPEAKPQTDLSKANPTK